MLAFFVRRLSFAAVALVAVAAIVYSMFDLPHGLERVFFHFDFGVTCSYPGCPAVTVLWGRTWLADIYLLLGGLALGVTAASPPPCSAWRAPARPPRARSRRSR